MLPWFTEVDVRFRYRYERLMDRYDELSAIYERDYKEGLQRSRELNRKIQALEHDLEAEKEAHARLKRDLAELKELPGTEMHVCIWHRRWLELESENARLRTILRHRGIRLW